MFPASKHLDIVMGIDIHIVLVPAPPSPTPIPTPLPHPFIGMLFDPNDYDLAAEAAKIGLDITPALDIKNVVDKVKGYSPTAMVDKLADKAQAAINEYVNIFPTPSKGLVKVNGIPRVHCGTPGYAMPPHFPMPPGVAFQAGKVGNECEAFMGSLTVAADQQPFSFLGCMVKTCHCPSSMKPTSVILTIPTGPPVLVGGPPVPSLTLLASKLFKKLFKKAFAKAMAALKKTKAAKWVAQKIHNAAGKAMDKLGIPKDSKLRDKVHDDICEKTGHPVIIATGKVVTSLTDFRLPGPVPLVWERNWKSTSRYEGLFGYGWHSNYDLALAYEEDAVVVRMADGRPVIFPPVKVGASFTNPFENMTLIREESAYLLRDGNNLYHRFEIRSASLKDDVLPLKSIETKAGHKIEFFYNGKNHLEKIIDSGGRNLDVTCDAKGRIVKIDAPHPEKRGETFTLVTYKYDGSGNLIEKRDAYNNPFSYGYNKHLLVKETNRNGLSFFFEYDGEDDTARCIHTWGDNGIFDHKLTYNLEEKWTQVEDSLGNKSKYYWTDMGVNWKIVDPLGNESFKRYTQHHKVQAEINELGQITSYEYDEFGNKTAINYPDGSTLKLKYENNLLVGATDQIGGAWAWEYNDHNQLIKRTDSLGRIVRYEYTNGLISKIIDPKGGETLIAFDENKNFDKLVFADGETSRWEYDGLGRPVVAIDPNGNVQKRKYNYLGWVLRINEPDGNIREFKYDAGGNVLHAQDKLRDVRFEYVDMNRLKALTEGGTRVEFKYDTESNLLGVINEHGYAYRFELDPNFRIVVESGFDGVTRRYKRDEAGRIIETVRANGLVTKYIYDLMDRVTSVNHSDGSFDKFDFRSDGELIEATNNHIKLKFERDKLGRILKEIQGSFVIESQYDLLGLRTEVASSLGTLLSFGRNIMGDVESVSANDNGQGWEAQFKRDNFGLELERSLPGGVRSEWKRDRLGRPTEQKTYSGGGRLERSREYIWDVNYRLKQITDSNSGITKFEHDVFGNLAGAVYGDGSNELRMPDAVGNLFRKADRSDRKYGPAGQLLEAEGTRYEYDAEGNLIKKITYGGATWRYEWNGAGMLKNVTRPDGDLVSFTYDALGRRLSKTYRDKTTRWVWDGNNILHEWVEKNYKSLKKEQAAFKENAEINIDNRTEQLTSTLTDVPPDYVEASLALFANSQIPANELTTWVFDPGRFVPLAKLNGERQYSIITDHLGTPASMYDDAGGKVWEMDLSIYGDVRNMDGWREACPFRYPGQYEDVETGLYYNRFRYYDAEGGRYINPDPIGLIGGMALYGYVKDTNSWTDAFGLAGTGGAYMFGFENGDKYIGKGEEKRMNQSIDERSTDSPLIGKAHVSTGGDNELGKMVEHKAMKDAGFTKENVPDDYLNNHLSGQTAWDNNPDKQAKATELAAKLKADYDADVKRREAEKCGSNS